MKLLLFLEDGMFCKLIELYFKMIFKDKLVAKMSYNIEILEEAIWDYKPDIFITHCHTNSIDFERIRILTKKIDQEMPRTTIIVSYNPAVELDNEYRETYLNGYSSDLMLSETWLIEKINNIIEIYQKKTAHNTAQK